MEQPGLALEQVNYAAQYLLPTQIYHEGSDQSDEHEQNEENKDVNEKSNSEENNGRIESELFVQTYLDVVFDEDVYEGKCKIWHLAEKIIGTHYSVIQISLVIWNQIEAAIQKYLNEQKMPLEDRYKYVLDKINKAKKATRKGMVVFPYIRIKQADPTSTSAIKLLELLKLEVDQLAFSDDELNNVWLSKIQTRTQNKARNREELRKKKKRKADEITLNETDLNVDKVNMNAVAGPPQKRQKKFSADYSFPPTEIREDSDSFLIIAQVPGLLRETLNVKFIEGTRQVIIEGTCALPQEIAFQWPHENLFMNTRPFTKTLTLDKNIIPAHSGILNLDSCPGYVFIKCTFNDISETHPQGLNENMNGLMHQGGVVNGADHVTVVLAQHEHIQIDTHNYVVITQLDGSEAEKQTLLISTKYSGEIWAHLLARCFNRLIRPKYWIWIYNLSQFIALHVAM